MDDPLDTQGDATVNFNSFSDSILELPLADVMRPEIALSLAHMMRIYTVGGFLKAWDNPSAQKHIEYLFETPQQASHAANLCASAAGWTTRAFPPPESSWWRAD